MIIGVVPSVLGARGADGGRVAVGTGRGCHGGVRYELRAALARTRIKAGMQSFDG